MQLSFIAFRNIKRNKRRSILSITATGIAAMSIVMLFSFKEGMLKNLEYNLKTFYTGEIRIRHKAFDKNELLNPLHLRINNYTEIIKRLENNPKVKEISPRITFPTAIYRTEKNHKALTMGIDFNLERSFQNLDKLFKEEKISGRFPSNSKNEILIGKVLASDLSLNIGDKITLLASTMRRGINAITFEIVGIIDFPIPELNKKYILAPLDRIRYFLRMGNSVTEILIKTNKKTKPEKFAENLNKYFLSEKKPELQAKSWRNIKTMYSLMEIADLVYNFIALFFFLLASTVIANTTMMVIYERIREIGTIGALGMNKNEIIRLFFLEASYLGIIGSSFGVLIGIIFTLILAKTGIDFSKAMENMQIEINKIIYPALSFKSTGFVFFYSSLIASLVSLIPSSRAAKINPAEALKKT